MAETTKSIAIVQGAAGEEIQRLLAEFVARHRGEARIVGLIEANDEAGGPDRQCGPGMLLSLADGRRYPMFQDLGAGSDACAFDPEGVVSAADAVAGQIAAGCDLVVLNKFGKYEAENRSGLVSAFQAAIVAEVPVLTSVSPRQAEAWDRFAAPFYTTLTPEAEALDAWWQEQRAKV
ncbi:DUF2478 domain-containing protein [Novosphingobium sp. JCM 18896]|uniref:DUF2478 domain-containing protein n=1 Tax=Novosphingobium sp. JCM 18896 TaxID=2989731 RepID=UPI002223B3F9|nr:DUF2478 domain-containing protein [Novosphingobium sp. JCM 18896]MCW1429904.1 DUF2478 domain-containing protein [Novosphingobium sp. JCM 18896]